MPLRSVKCRSCRRRSPSASPSARSGTTVNDCCAADLLEGQQAVVHRLVELPVLQRVVDLRVERATGGLATRCSVPPLCALWNVAGALAELGGWIAGAEPPVAFGLGDEPLHAVMPSVTTDAAAMRRTASGSDECGTSSRVLRSWRASLGRRDLRRRWIGVGVRRARRGSRRRRSCRRCSSSTCGMWLESGNSCPAHVRDVVEERLRRPPASPRRSRRDHQRGNVDRGHLGRRPTSHAAYRPRGTRSARSWCGRRSGPRR